MNGAPCSNCGAVLFSSAKIGRIRIKAMKKIKVDWVLFK
jgi:hypothetical protein